MQAEKKKRVIRTRYSNVPETDIYSEQVSFHCALLLDVFF